MRESLGGSMLLNLVVIFTGLIIIFFVGILSYSKAYRVKNRIVEIIEKYGTYEKIDSSTNTNIVTDELNNDLKAAGYETSLSKKCDTIRTRLVNEKYDSSLSQNINKNYALFIVAILLTFYIKGDIINRNTMGISVCIFRIGPEGRYFDEKSPENCIGYLDSVDSGAWNICVL